MSRSRIPVLATFSLSLVLIADMAAQTRPPVAPAQYGQFESVQLPQRNGGLSPDGRWIAYTVNRVNRNNELRIAKIDGGTPVIVPFGTQPVFGADSRWAAYSIGVSEAQEEKLRKDKKPVRLKAGLLNLETSEKSVVDDIESFAFNAAGTFVALRRYAPEPDKKPAEGSAVPDEPPVVGSTLIVRALATGRDTTFGNVSEFAWQDKGRLLAITIATEDKTGNSIQLFDPESGALRALDSAAAVYGGLAWRKESDDLAVLRSKSDDRHEGSTHVVLAWRNVGNRDERARAYDPTADSSFMADMRTVSYRKPAWSHDGGIVFVGVAKWHGNVSGPARRTTSNGAADDDGHVSAQPPASSSTEAEPDEPAGVDVWHWRDVDVMPKQKLAAKADRERSLLSAWHVDNGQFVQLGRHATEQVTPVKHQRFAYAEDWTPYAMERSIGRPAADVSLIDLATGDRMKLKDRIDDRYAQISPGGRYVLYLQDDHFWTINTATRTVTNITKSVATSFIDRESDQTVKQKPAYGVAGWTTDDESVILYDKFDLWQLAPDGSRATKLTDGAADQTRHRYVRLNADEEWIDSSRSLYVSLFGIWSKKAGYGRLRLPNNFERLVWLDKSVSRLAKAKDADAFIYSVERFDEPPAFFATAADLTATTSIIKTNAFRAEYAWGRSEIIEYKTDRGDRLQGALYYPAGYEPGKRYPTIVYLYERLSDGVHRWINPSEREPYNVAAFTSLGYAVLEPDIVFRPREPGLSVVECVTPAVKKAIQMGVTDGRRVGVVGHSWGGFDTTFLATHTTLFAAAVAGAPITNLVSNYGNHHWSSGIAETDHIETGQQRMEVPLWEDLQAYIRNSAVFNVQSMTTPLLIEVGDNDGTVFWHQGIELYNVARRAKKEVVLIAYAGEDHGLRKKPNQLDYHRRIVEWFGHYLKGEQAPEWVANGVRYIDRERELKQLKAQKPKSSG